MDATYIHLLMLVLFTNAEADIVGFQAYPNLELNSMWCQQGSLFTTEYWLEQYSNDVGIEIPKILYSSDANGTVNLTWIDNIPSVNKLNYKWESTYIDSFKCKLCPYQSIDIPDICDAKDIRACYTPMFAYCLNSQFSRKMSCVQDNLMYPVEFYGEIFYPPQRSFDPLLAGLNDIPAHQILQLEENMQILNISNPDPREYGLSRVNVIEHLRKMFEVPNTNDENQPYIVQVLRNKYDNMLNWGLWGQKQCEGFCHRDNMYLLKYMIEEDIRDKPNLFILNISFQDINFRNEPHIVCRPCLDASDAVVYLKSAEPITLDINTYWMLGSTCIPWFGVVPFLSSTGGGLLNFVSYKYIIGSGRLVDLESYQDYEYYGLGVSNSEATVLNKTWCPVNTYNRICALTLRSWANDVSHPMFNKVECTPCPSGYHTGGKTGSWFCLPPPGSYFFNWRQLTRHVSPATNISKAWARRDLIKYELECGTSPSMCNQCKNVSGASGMTPDTFNQEFIFKPLLEVRVCPEDYYCSESLQEPKRCPPNRCSPLNSTSIQDCTCCPGSFLNVQSGECQACRSPTSCGIGEYLMGYTTCMYTRGPKSVYGGGICQNCSSKPISNSVYIDRAGIELLTQTSSVVHFCPFECNQGYKVTFSTSLATCFRPYSCDPIQTPNPLAPVALVGGGFAYNPSLKQYRDRVTLTLASTCNVLSDFNTMFQSWLSASPSPNVNSMCRNVNSSACSSSNSLCTVSEEATLFQDYVCQSCHPSLIAKPEEATFLSDALNGFTDITKRDNLCKWTCNTGFYRNNSLCSSCTDLSNSVCQVGYFIEGNGCLGVTRPFLEPLNLNCRNCSKSMDQVASNQYLDYATCSIKNCSAPVIEPGKYISKACGKEFGSYEYSTCKSCSSSQYRSAACQSYTNTICIECTQTKPGYYKVSNCSLDQDAFWTLCEAGYYCVGDGLRLRCPVDRMSLSGATSISECYCRVGTELNNEGICVEKLCVNSFDTFWSPSISNNIISSHYYYLDQFYTTQCAPCNLNVQSWNSQQHSFARGNRVGIKSCKCPLNQYSNLINLNDFSTNVTCSSCASRPNTGCVIDNAFFIRTNAYCPNGDQYGSIGCECALPPFTVKSPASCSITGCELGFVEYVPGSSSDVPATSSTQKVTGSSLYTNRLTWFLGFEYPAFPIKKVRVSSDFMQSEYQTSNIQYAMWTTSASINSHVIFIQKLNYNTDSKFNPCLTDNGFPCNPYEQTEKWNVLCSSDILNGYELIDFTIAKWPNAVKNVYFTPEYGTFPWLWTWVGALVYSRQTKRYFVWNAKLAVSDLADAYVYLEDSNRFCGPSNMVADKHLLNTSVFHENTAVVSFTHAYSFPGLLVWTRNDNPNLAEVRNSVFYITYNIKATYQCGVQAMLKSNTIEYLHLNLTHSNKRQILASSVIENFYESSGRGVFVYILFSGSPGIQIIKWLDASMTSNTDVASIETNTIDIFLPLELRSPSSIFHDMTVMWPRDINIKGVHLLLADAFNENLNVYDRKIYTADGIQRTFTEVQGMPLYSSPTSVAGYENGLSSGHILGSGKSSIFSLPVNMCVLGANSPPKYFDGSQCRVHRCYRTTGCLDSENKFFNPASLSCECKPGYYSISQTSITCIRCPQNSHCSRNQRFPCPSNLISRPGSEQLENCRCVDAYYYNNITQSCISCPSGSYCPNNWDKIQCPGKTKLRTGFDFYLSPVSCTCDAGHEGASCTLCPEGSRCIQSSASPNYVQNAAVLIHVNLKYKDANMLTVVCSVLRGAIKEFFGLYPANFLYFKNNDLLFKRTYCTFIESSDIRRTSHMIALMIQIDQQDQGTGAISQMFTFYDGYENLNRINSALIQYLEVIKIVPDVSSSKDPFLYSFQQNSIQTCSAGYTSNEDRTQCECRAGYEYVSLNCRECPKGWFKSSIGMGRCQQCPLGKTTQGIASTSCINLVDGNGTIDDSGSKSTESPMPIIIGSAVGGVVFVVLVIFGFYFFGTSKK